MTSAATLASELGVLNIGHVKYKSEFLTSESYKFDDRINYHIGIASMSNDFKTGVVDKIVKFLEFQIYMYQVVRYFLHLLF